MARKKKKSVKTRNPNAGSGMNGSFKKYEEKIRKEADENVAHLIQEISSIISELQTEWAKVSDTQTVVARRTKIRAMSAKAGYCSFLIKKCVSQAMVSAPPKFSSTDQQVKRVERPAGWVMPAIGTTKKPGSWSDGRHS